MQCGFHIRPLFINAAMNKPFEIQCPPLCRIDRCSVEIKFDDVSYLSNGWADRAGKEITIMTFRVTHANVPVGVQDIVLSQYPVGDNHIANGAFYGVHAFSSSYKGMSFSVGRFAGQRPISNGGESSIWIIIG